MSVTKVIRTLHNLGVNLEIRGGRLRVDAPSTVMTDDLRQTIREHKGQIIELLSAEQSANTTKLPTYIKHCKTCNGTNWDHTGTFPNGIEVWGCFDCSVSPARAHSDVCPECHGPHIVTDMQGKYCLSCKRRPWERKEPEPAPELKYVGVRWGNEQGWLRLTDPVSGEVAEVVAKGLPRWIFDRLKSE